MEGRGGGRERYIGLCIGQNTRLYNAIQCQAVPPTFPPDGLVVVAPKLGHPLCVVVTGCELAVWLLAGGEGATVLAVHLHHTGGQIGRGDGQTATTPAQVLGGGDGGQRAE